MGKIDTTDWGIFTVSQFCETKTNVNKLQVPTGANIPAKDLDENGNTPRITVTGVNNGVFGTFNYIGKTPADYRVFNNFVSVSFLGTVFYQENDASLDMKVHCIKPLNITLNQYTGQFLVSAIKASLRKSSYSDQISSTVLPNMEVRLPIDNQGNPNWQYMEDYMKSIEVSVSNSLSKLASAKDTKKKQLDVSGWGEYVITDLFDVEKVTNKLKNSDLVDNGSVLVYSSTTENNGVFGKTNKPAEFTISNQVPFYLIFGDHTKSMFLVKNDFSVMDNVKILKPHIFNEYIIQFIITMWSKSIPNLGYARHWTVAKNIPILLPITSDGSLDYKYMEEYMKKIEEKTQEKLSKFYTLGN